MTDRQIAYRQNLAGLEKAWAERLTSFAKNAVETAAGEGEEDVQMVATEAVAAKLFDSTHWEAVEAVDISDVAYEAVAAAIREARLADWQRTSY